jgi:hypothetical protein
VPVQEQQQGQEEGVEAQRSSKPAAEPQPQVGTDAAPRSASQSHPLQLEAGEASRIAAVPAADSSSNPAQQSLTPQQQTGNTEPARGSAAAAAASAAAAADSAAAAAVPDHPGLVVLVCGVQPPLHTPLAWLHAQVHAPDYFLYVVVHASRS